MTFREACPGLDVEIGSGGEAVQGRCIPLFPVLIGLLAAINVASVVFALVE